MQDHENILIDVQEPHENFEYISLKQTNPVSEGTPRKVKKFMFKNGDDLRQDNLVL